MGGGGASRPPTAATSMVVAPPPCPNIPLNLHPGNGNAVTYDLQLDCTIARILLLNDDMGGNNKDCNNKYNDDTGDGDCDNGGEGRGRQRHRQRRQPPPNNDIVIA